MYCYAIITRILEHQLDGIGHGIDVDKEDHGESSNAGRPALYKDTE